jgi:DNA-binding NarL/FixJ family response regulator
MTGDKSHGLAGGLAAAFRHGHKLKCLAALQRAFDAGPSTPGHRPGTTAAVQGIVEPLTSRELEVLQLLAAGMPNQGIARQLVVSLDTVKSTSATSWTSSARPAAPRPSPGPAS